MQPITSWFIQNNLQIGQEEIYLENAFYSVKVKDTSLFIMERNEDQVIQYEVLWALGGKNVYYFLTPFEGGRLQTLPLAYRIAEKKWYNNPESAVRHFPLHQNEQPDEALSWKHRQYTFNTACYSCHVSQLSNHYSIETNTYQTHWEESGINCETCHGPALEHVKAARLAEKKGIELTDLKLIVTSTFTPDQHNSSCGTCHAKMSPITSSYFPGESFFNHYNLICLESNDFYPDGRDLGENYTMTSWHQNTCTQKSELHCIDCHTSSGRYRFTSADLNTANKACTNCHTNHEAEYEAHTHHPFSPKSPTCTDCHMPTTQFGNMTRSDHSFRPPMPKATIEFGSPNACNLCHSDQTPQWSQNKLEIWKKDKGYQNKTLEAARLLVHARNENWKFLEEITNAIATNRYGEVYTTSYLRLLTNCTDTLKRNAAHKAFTFDSPLIRSAAVQSLYGFTDEITKKVLIKAASDSVLLVRLAAANSLTQILNQLNSNTLLAIYQKVSKEYITSLVTRSDDWSNYYNLGNYFYTTGENNMALQAYETAYQLNNETILPLVNSSIIYSLTGNNLKAEEQLLKALKIEPENEAANFNYALLMAEEKETDKAEVALRKVLDVNPKNASAAYNLAIIVAPKSLDQACSFSKIAYENQPDEPRYGYTYAFYLYQKNENLKAIDILEVELKRHPHYQENEKLLLLIKNNPKQ